MEGQTRPKRHGVLKTKFGLKLGGAVEKGRRGRREEEEEGGFKPRSSKKVWKLNLCMDSMRLCMNFHALMVIILPKSRVFARVSS